MLVKLVSTVTPAYLGGVNFLGGLLWCVEDLGERGTYLRNSRRVRLVKTMLVLSQSSMPISIGRSNP